MELSSNVLLLLFNFPAFKLQYQLQGVEIAFNLNS